MLGRWKEVWKLKQGDQEKPCCEEIGKGLTVKVVCKRRFEGNNALNDAVKWEKCTPGRGKDQGKGLDVKACRSEGQQEVCRAGGDCTEESVAGFKVGRVTRVQYREGSHRPLSVGSQQRVQSRKLT